jgi:hypothetical protein
MADPEPYLLCDALALVGKELWAHATFRESPTGTDTIKVPRGFVEHLSETLCYAPSMDKVKLQAVREQSLLDTRTGRRHTGGPCGGPTNRGRRTIHRAI